MLEYERYPLGKRPDLVEGIVKITLPRRTVNRPSGIDHEFVNEVTRRWSAYRSAIIGWLAIRPGLTLIDLLRFDDESLNEKFTLAKSNIRNRLKIKRSEDVRIPYRYFALGTQVGKGVSGDSILTITRRELLQLYILTYARKYIIWKLLPARATRDDLMGLFGDIDRLMMRKPERGVPPQ